MRGPASRGRQTFGRGKPGGFAVAEVATNRTRRRKSHGSRKGGTTRSYCSASAYRVLRRLIPFQGEAFLTLTLERYRATIHPSAAGAVIEDEYANGPRTLRVAPGLDHRCVCRPVVLRAIGPFASWR